MKFYSVARGKHPGIYLTWDECKAQTQKVKGAVFKSFKSVVEAEAFYKQYNNGLLPKNKTYRNKEMQDIAQQNQNYNQIEPCIICGVPMRVTRRKRGPSWHSEGICDKCNQKRRAYKQFNPQTSTVRAYSVDEMAWILHQFPCSDVWGLLTQRPDIGVRARIEAYDGCLRAYLQMRKQQNSSTDTKACPQWLKDKLGINRTFVKMTGDPRDPLVLYHCDICDEDFAARYSALKWNKAHHCASNTSSGETCVKKYLEACGVSYRTQRDTLRCINPATGHVLPYDFEIPDKKVIIEVQGEQHRRFVPVFHVDADGFAYQQWKDAYKKQFAIDHGYRFVEVWYADIESKRYKTIIDTVI